MNGSTCAVYADPLIWIDGVEVSACKGMGWMFFKLKENLAHIPHAFVWRIMRSPSTRAPLGQQGPGEPDVEAYRRLEALVLREIKWVAELMGHKGATWWLEEI